MGFVTTSESSQRSPRNPPWIPLECRTDHHPARWMGNIMSRILGQDKRTRNRSRSIPPNSRRVIPITPKPEDSRVLFRWRWRLRRERLLPARASTRRALFHRTNQNLPGDPPRQLESTSQAREGVHQVEAMPHQSAILHSEIHRKGRPQRCALSPAGIHQQATNLRVDDEVQTYLARQKDKHHRARLSGITYQASRTTRK